MALNDRKKRFTESVVWIEKMLPQICFDEEEVDYKLAYAERMRAVRESWQNGTATWAQEFVGALQPSNLLNWRYESELVRLAQTNSERLSVLLGLLWESKPTAGKFNSFVSQLREFSDTFTPGVATTVASAMLMVHEGDNYPPYRHEAVRRFWKTMRWAPLPRERSTPYKEYMHFLRSLKEFQNAAASTDLQVDNLIRVQGYMWLITEWDPRTALPSHEVAAFKGWRGDSSGSEKEEEGAASLRAVVLAKLQHSQENLFSEHELLNFTTNSELVPLMDTRSQSLVPKGFDAPLSIAVSSYSMEQLDGASGVPHIRFPRKRRNLKHSQDQSLLRAIELNVPFVVIVERGSKEYQVIHPVRVSRYVHKDHEFELDLSRVYLPLELSSIAPEYVRRWVAGTARQRIHQPIFRRDVMRAYGNRCAVCGLEIPQLLDAAHIVPDSEKGGIASASNGLVLCKLHHTAFDAKLLGIDEKWVIHISPKVMKGSYGLSVKSNLRRYDGCDLQAAPRLGWEPKPELLRIAWNRFQGEAMHP